MARLTGLEPATPGVTGRYSNQLSYNRPLHTRLAAARWHVLGGRIGRVKRVPGLAREFFGPRLATKTPARSQWPVAQVLQDHLPGKLAPAAIDLRPRVEPVRCHLCRIEAPIRRDQA